VRIAHGEEVGDCMLRGTHPVSGRPGIWPGTNDGLDQWPLRRWTPSRCRCNVNSAATVLRSC